MDLFRKKNRQPQREWTNTGSFMSKPEKGWLHPDEQLAPDAGVCFGVRYVGAMEVKESMKTLDFETRTAVAKESISRVCDAAGLKTASKKSKRSAKVSRILGDEPIMLYAGRNVNLTITTDSLNIMDIECGDVIGVHHMPSISFASGGDADTLDFVAYIAKDENGRQCHVVECGGGLAQDVITTIGQAFELRFKMYLNNKPQPVNLPSRSDSVRPPPCDQWGEEPDYYNDREGARPPSPVQPPPLFNTTKYDAPQSNRPVSDIVYSSIKKSPADVNLINFDDDVFSEPRSYMDDLSVLNTAAHGAVSGEAELEDGGGVNRDQGGAASSVPPTRNLDAFDMKPFCATLPSDTAPGGADGSTDMTQEKWYHGKISRQQCEQLLVVDGAFLVRESPSSPGQFVLSGRHNGRIKHLLLVDPEGVVRTRDNTFASVGHLVDHHMTNNLPITSQDTEIHLNYPVLRATHS